MYNYALLNNFNKFDILPKIFPMPAGVCVVRYKKKGSFYAAVTEEQIILAVLSHHKIEPDAWLLYFRNAHVFLFSSEKNTRHFT